MSNKELATEMIKKSKPESLMRLLEDYFLYLSEEQIKEWKEIYSQEHKTTT